MKTKQEMIALLNDLGKTPEEVAQRLFDLGIKGYRNRCSACPITEFVSRHMPENAWVETTYNNMSARSSIEVETENDFILDFSPTIRNFIFRFDKGEFPFLDRQP